MEILYYVGSSQVQPWIHPLQTGSRGFYYRNRRFFRKLSSVSVSLSPYLLGARLGAIHAQKGFQMRVKIVSKASCCNLRCIVTLSELFCCATQVLFPFLFFSLLFCFFYQTGNVLYTLLCKRQTKVEEKGNKI